ncbi:uncharacterized protein LOC130049950 [Ostrea edulis]|uniref:uncharacterized protein LOC130049950 n=1 Tax=Ostrea edulis TaxID=37623 RepID=UPI0024AEC919|nr:uncharacterized protein LOC130049950 [Ostrea edulis]
MSLNQEAKEKAWLENYERVLNVEFDWDPEHLTDEPPLEGPPVPITIDMVKKAISKTKSGKAAGPSGIAVEMIRAAGDTGEQLPGTQTDRTSHESPGEDVDSLIRQLVTIDDSQFGIVPGRGTTDAIFIVRQLQEKYLTVNKRFCMGFVNLEKAFDRVPQKMIWWALRKLSVEAWIVRLVQEMYVNARSCVRR